MDDCIFCRIIQGEIPSQVLYEDEQVLAFRDVQPQAPVHVLVVPKKHFSNLNEMEETSLPLLFQSFRAIKTLTHQLGISVRGYRCVVNTNSEGGQSVYHLHFHLLGGQTMGPLMTGSVNSRG